MWKAVHPDMTSEVRIPDEDGASVFTIGFWPPRESVRMERSVRSMLVNLKKRYEEPSIEMDSAALENDYDACRSIIRWGCRGWSGGTLAPSGTVPETIDGRIHAALCDASIDLVAVNNLMAELAIEVVKFNILTDDTRGKFVGRSGSFSKSHDMNAADAAPAIQQKMTEPFHSDSKTGPGQGRMTAHEI